MQSPRSLHPKDSGKQVHRCCVLQMFKLQQGGETNWAQCTRGGFQEIRSKKVLESAQPGCLDYFIMLAFTLRSKRSNGVVGGFTLGEYPGLTYTFMGTLCGLY